MMQRFQHASQRGFSLLESIISVTLIALLVNGLFLTWQFVESKTNGFDQYSQAKTALETAYEITIHNLREAKTIAIINNGDGVSLTKTDNSICVFTKNNDVYQMQQNGTIENLLTGCAKSNFQVTNSMLTVNLAVVPPATWSDATDLSISGNAFPRN